MTDLTTMAAELEALQERLRVVEQTWLAHVEATTRMNAAVPDVVNGTPAERAVYDVRYRIAEEAKREVYRVTQSLAIWAAENKAADAIDTLLAVLKARGEMLAEASEAIGVCIAGFKSAEATTGGMAAIQMLKDAQQRYRTALEGKPA